MKKTICAVVLLSFLGGIGLAQSITVNQPAANVTWNIGSTYLIQWTSTGVAKPTVKIMLWKGSTFVMDIVVGTPNNGSYSWTIPANVAPGVYKVRVRAIGADTLGVGAAFNIAAASTPETPAGPIKVIARPLERPGFQLKFPALSITDAVLSSNNEEFVVTFSYKNSGGAPLPKGSEMPVKPSFRVLIDDREVNAGSLYIPEFPAQPGWEVPTFHGCVIKYQTGQEFDKTWKLGNTITVKINENGVNGMASDSKTYNLKLMALKISYDAILTGATVDWVKETLTVNVRIDGNYGTLGKFRLFNKTSDSPVVQGFGSFMETIDIVPGQRLYSYTKKLDGLSRWRNEYTSYTGVLLVRAANSYPDVRDIDHRNNTYNNTFRR